jgi:altronate hydrolase
MQSRTIRLNPADNVVTARTEISQGAAVENDGVTAAANIPVGHKVATAAIASGEVVRKYNQIIGFATEDIAVGSHVHSHNCAFGEFERDYAFGQDVTPTDYIAENERATFQGFVRENGSVATRNYVAVLSTVNCSATVVHGITSAFAGDALKDYPNVDGVAAFTHGTGCGSGGRDNHDQLQRVMWGYIRHPNCAGVLLVGLGCEGNQISFLLDVFGLEAGPNFQYMNIQDTGGTRATIEVGIAKVKSMLPLANQATRTTVSAEHITLALQCGGSDAYSGITANPSLGAATDLLVRNGGTAILAETPEIYGAEHLLTRRAVSREIGEKLIERIKWWKDYTAKLGASLDNNPSPGNKAGGLTTILEKSLGAVAKGGTTNLMGVYKYAERVTEKGFVFMDSPGYDPCSITGEVASGANVICFTTGRGSVFGYKPAPSIKLATNSTMFNRMSEDMDINCGAVLDENISVSEMGQRIFDTILDVASGTPSKSEALGFGDHEFVPWQIGAYL